MDADEMTLRGNILALGRSRPRIGNTVWIAPGTVVIGRMPNKKTGGRIAPHI
jgi:serine acetyltransferase